MPVIADDEEGSPAQAFGLNAFPHVVLMDGNGTVLAGHAGEFTMAKLGDLLAQVDESPPPAALPAGAGIPGPAGD